jgi:NTE family protein
MRRCQFEPGEVVFRAGEPSDGLVSVIAGEVELVAAGGAPLGMAGAGQLLGEIGFLLAQPRSATARAGPDGAEVGLISANDVQRLLDTHPAVAIELSRSLSRKLAATTEAVAAADTHLALVVGEADDLLIELAKVSPHKIGIVTLDGAPKPPRRRAFRQVKVDDLLAHLRLGDSRFADLPSVLVLAGKGRHLVADTVEPVAGWVVGRSPFPAWVKAGRRLSLDDPISLRRAVRWLTGTAVGLALSSGGSKTVAHVGVLAALTDSEVPIDAITGCSGGAAFAGGWLAGATTEELIVGAERLGAILSGRRFEPAMLPKVAEIKGERVRRLLEEWFEEALVEEMPIPAAMVATDLATGDSVSIRRGSLTDAVRASMAIPALLSPWKVGDRWCSDGAVVEPVPVQALRELGVGTVIASSVAGRGNRLRSRPALTEDKGPGLMQVISSVITASEAARATAALTGADVVIAPEVDATGSFDFTDVPANVEVGRTAALQVLESAKLPSE